jgi:beta-galactosidase GanA
MHSCRGVYRADGVFAFEPFFAAAKKAGIYLIARPGPVSHKSLSLLYMI